MDKLYGTSEAARLLGLGVWAVRYHVRAGNLPARRIGHSLVFTEAALARFALERRRPGRPRHQRDGR